MPYGEKRRQQYYKIKYQFNYPSGKKWTTEEKFLAYSELGAKDSLLWLFKGRNITIISIEPTYEYAGDEIYPTNHVIGER